MVGKTSHPQKRFVSPKLSEVIELLQSNEAFRTLGVNEIDKLINALNNRRAVQKARHIY